MKRISGAAAIIESLLAEDVEVIFGYPGGAIMPVYDALYDYLDQIKHVLVRHEQAAAHAAEGYARLANKPGVCLATSGPGATNLVTGIADAMMDSVPIVCITGQVASASLGTDAFQETDVIGITIPITKWNYQITDAREIPEIFAKAFHIAASGRPGPVLIDITKDAQFAEIDFAYEKVTSIKNFAVPAKPDQQNLAEAAKLIAAAERPLIFAGHGILIANAAKTLTEFSEKSGIPVACTLHGLSAIPVGHPNYVGMLGMHGNYGPNFLSNDADLIIAVGMRFDDRVTGNVDLYLPDSKIIHIEIDPAEVGKIMQVDVSLIADAKLTLAGLTRLISEKSYPEWMSKFSACNEQEEQTVIEPFRHYSEQEASQPPKMLRVIDTLSRITDGQAVIVGDVGQHQMMSARYYKYQQPDSWITSGGLGTMGFALPAAIGAKFARQDRLVIAVIGDGCFQMTIQELATIAQEELDVKILILNNSFLGMVRQWQEMFFEKRYSFTELKNPDFVAISKGFGLPSSAVETNAQLEAALTDFVNHKGPYVLEVKVEKENNVFPMVPSGKGVKDIRLE